VVTAPPSRRAVPRAGCGPRRLAPSQHCAILLISGIPLDGATLAYPAKAMSQAALAWSRQRAATALLLLVACTTEVQDERTSSADAAVGEPRSDAAPDAQPRGPCNEAEVATLFASACAMGGCHTAADAKGGLGLESPDLGERLAAQESATCGPLLVPGSAADSVLVQSMSPNPNCGPSMPPTLPLVPTDVECVATWIDRIPAASD